MLGHMQRVWVPDSRKGEVGKRLEKAKAVEKRDRRCLFVIGEDGRMCRNTVSIKCHAIPEASVLGELKDRRSGKVLELKWGVSQWQHLFVRSSESSPIDLKDASDFDPQSVGAGDACVGRFTCKIGAVDHDGEFGPIDIREPDLTDPVAKLLIMYRMVLYIGDQCRVGKQFIDDWDKEGMRNPDRGKRYAWVQHKIRLKSGQQRVQAIASKLGKVWCARKNHRDADLAIVSGDSFYFRSSLKFAFSGLSRKGVGVLVVPVGDDRHKMSVLHLREEADSVKEDKERLLQLVGDSEDINNDGIQVVEGLMKDGWGIMAASPESYRELPDAGKQTIRRLVADSSSPESPATMFAPRHSQPRGRRNRRRVR